jgi:hypothetical protein
MTENDWLSVATLTLCGAYAGLVMGRLLPQRRVSAGTCLMMAIIGIQSILSLQDSIPLAWMLWIQAFALVLALVALAWKIAGDVRSS